MAYSFEKWIAKVDQILGRRFGLGHNDLPDWQWWEMFDSEVSPREAVEDFIEEMRTNPY